MESFLSLLRLEDKLVNQINYTIEEIDRLKGFDYTYLIESEEKKLEVYKINLFRCRKRLNHILQNGFNLDI